MSIDHEAAKKFAPECACLFVGTPHGNLARAYLDLHEQLAAKDRRIAALADLVKFAFDDGWDCQIADSEDGGMNVGAQLSFENSDTADKLARIMEDTQ